MKLAGLSVARKRKNLTQEKLSEILGVTNITISRWETGENEPDISTLQKLSDILGVTIDELVNGSPEKEAQNA